METLYPAYQARSSARQRPPCWNCQPGESGACKGSVARSAPPAASSDAEIRDHILAVSAIGAERDKLPEHRKITSREILNAP
jgi:hypothetical protein